jgi:hypothetical protein
MSERTWSEESLEWHSVDPDSGELVRDDPPQPAWADDPAGLAARFVRLWQASGSISEVCKVLFWVSVEELVAHRRSMNAFLVDNGYAPLAALPLRQGAALPRVAPILSAGELAAMESEGVVMTFVAAAAAAEAAAIAAAAVPEPVLEDGELDLTPTPPRPDEDPYRGVSPLSLAIPGYGRNDPLYEYYYSMGADKMRIRIKH